MSDGTMGYSDVPASYGICIRQLPDGGPQAKAVALPDELAAQIVKEQWIPYKISRQDPVDRVSHVDGSRAHSFDWR